MLACARSFNRFELSNCESRESKQKQCYFLPNANEVKASKDANVNGQTGQACLEFGQSNRLVSCARLSVGPCGCMCAFVCCWRHLLERPAECLFS